MPKRSRKATRSRRSMKKRKIYRAKRKARYTPRLTRNLINPDGIVVKLRYCEQINLDPGIATMAYHTWRANSIFDPNYSGAGHQPLGHDDWARFYTRYIVLGAKIKFIAWCPTPQTGYGQIATVTCDDSTGVLAVPIDSIIEQRGTPYKFYQTNQANNKCVVTGYYSPKRVFQVKDTTDNEDLWSLFGQNPVLGAYFHTKVHGFDASTDNPLQYCRVVIDYIVRLAGPQMLPQS